MSACTQVLAIPELLEQILLYLPSRDALLSQRVHTTFRNTIASSPPLQRHLFLQLSSTPSSNTRANHILLHNYNTNNMDYELHIPGINLTPLDSDATYFRCYSIDASNLRNFLATNASCLEMYLQDSKGRSSFESITSWRSGMGDGFTT